MKILSDSSKTSDLMIIITLMHLQIDPISFMTTELTKYKKKTSAVVFLDMEWGDMRRFSSAAVWILCESKP